MKHVSDGKVFGIKLVEMLLHPATDVASPVVLDTVINDGTDVCKKLVVTLVTQDASSVLIRTLNVGNGVPAIATKLAHVTWG